LSDTTEEPPAKKLAIIKTLPHFNVTRQVLPLKKPSPTETNRTSLNLPSENKPLDQAFITATIQPKRAIKIAPINALTSALTTTTTVATTATTPATFTTVQHAPPSIPSAVAEPPKPKCITEAELLNGKVKDEGWTFGALFCGISLTSHFIYA
jgi:hypothetical protein